MINFFNNYFHAQKSNLATTKKKSLQHKKAKNSQHSFAHFDNSSILRISNFTKLPKSKIIVIFIPLPSLSLSAAPQANICKTIKFGDD